MEGGTIDLSNARLVNNEVTGFHSRGGVVLVERAGTFRCSNCTVTGNRAEPSSRDAAGGVIWISGGYAVFERCTVTDSESASGAVVYLLGGKVVVAPGSCGPTYLWPYTIMALCS